MASSKGKEALEEQYSTISIYDEEDIEVNMENEEDDDSDTESFMLVSSLITDKKVKFNYMKEISVSIWRLEGARW